LREKKPHHIPYDDSIEDEEIDKAIASTETELPVDDKIYNEESTIENNTRAHGKLKIFMEIVNTTTEKGVTEDILKEPNASDSTNQDERAHRGRNKHRHHHELVSITDDSSEAPSTSSAPSRDFPSKSFNNQWSKDRVCIFFF
jgi:hypothetical protein